jgi:hypothetical protein
MEVVAVEIAAAVRTGGRALRTATTAGALPTAARSPLTTPSTTTTSAILHQDQPGLVGSDGCIWLDICADHS